MKEYNRALRFAAMAHKDQLRKDNITPYIVHPVAVAQWLISGNIGSDHDYVLAALLHDTVEDTDVTLSDIEANFSSNVTLFVKELTDDKALTKVERRKQVLKDIPYWKRGSCLIKLADIIDNVESLIESPPRWSPQVCLKFVHTCHRRINALQRNKNVNSNLPHTRYLIETARDAVHNATEHLYRLYS